MKIALNSSDGRFELSFLDRSSEGTELEIRFDLGSWSTDMSRGVLRLETRDQTLQLAEDFLSCLADIRSDIILNNVREDFTCNVREFFRIKILTDPPLIVGRDKRLLKIEIKKGPNISIDFLFLIDITIVDEFEETINTHRNFLS